MRSSFATCGLLLLFFCGSRPAEERVIAQHGIDEYCPESVRVFIVGSHKCKTLNGALTYTLNDCFLKLDTVTYHYTVKQWDAKGHILYVEDFELEGYFKITEQYAQFFINPRDKRKFKSTTITLRFYKTIYYRNDN